MKLVVSVPRQGKHAAREPVRRTDVLVHAPVQVLCPQARLRIPLLAQPGRAFAPEFEPPRLAGELVHGSGSEQCPGTAPHQLTALVLRVPRDQLGEPVRVLPRWGDAMQHEADPGLAHPETPLVVIVIGKVGLVAALEVGDVIAA